jgi:hypothetical protein
MWEDTGTACSSEGLSSHRSTESQFLVHVARGHALDQVLQPIDAAQVGSQHERLFPWKLNLGHSEFPAPRIPPKTPTPSLIQTAFTPSQFEREANGLFDLRHHIGGKLSQLAF